jgi:hypothetical protein
MKALIDVIAVTPSQLNIRNLFILNRKLLFSVRSINAAFKVDCILLAILVLIRVRFFRFLDKLQTISLYSFSFTIWKDTDN